MAAVQVESWHDDRRTECLGQVCQPERKDLGNDASVFDAELLRRHVSGFLRQYIPVPHRSDPQASSASAPSRENPRIPTSSVTDAIPTCEACGRPDEKPIYAIAPRLLLCRDCHKLTLIELVDRLLDRGIDVHARMPVLID